MSLFSRNKEPVEPVRADDVPFESLRRSPRDAARGSRRHASSARTTESEVDTGPLDPAHAEKTRARRRLLGAIALALAAIVFVPMLFDRTQVPPVDDIAVQIPGRDTPFEGRLGASDPGKGPLRPLASLPAASPPPVAVNSVPVGGVGAETPPPAVAGDAAGVMPAEPASEKPSGEPAAKAVERGAEQNHGKAVEKKAEAHEKSAGKRAEASGDKGGAITAAPGDDPRALAALEGKAVPHAGGESASGKGFAVQIGAYSAAGRAKTLRDQLNANGLKAYTELLSTPQGPRTRVRLGPFPTREAAERARKKLRTMKLDGSVVTL